MCSPPGEEHKNLDTVRDVYRFLIEEGFDRKDMLLALGGGVCGDLTGFVAATYLRGIDFVQIPTTLLAQADSSIGGKTGVDFDSYKNMVGAFKMPRLVYMNLSVLKTLEERQFYSGFAEVMKSALIKDAPFYEWLIENMYEICRAGSEYPGRNGDPYLLHQENGGGKGSYRAGRPCSLKSWTHDRTCYREIQEF